MSRIEINLPEKFDFSTNVPIRITDINRGVHVGYAAILDILSEARAQYLASKNCEDQAIIVGGQGFIMGDMGIIYKSQAYYGESIKIEVTAAEFQPKSFDLIYRISDAKTGQEIVRAKTALLLYNYNEKKVMPITDEIKKKLGVL